MTTSIRILVFVAVFCVGLQHVADSAHTGTSQMIDQSSSSLAQLRRPRREVYREIKKFQLCCEQTYEEEEEEEEDEVVEKCYIQAMNKLGIEERESKEENTKGPNDGAERERFGNYSVCFVECVFKEFKMADCNGNVIPDEAIKFMDPSTFVESDKLWNGVRNKCFKVKTGIEQNTLCNRAASDYVECVYHFADMYCPAEKQVKDPICDYLRMTLRKKYNVEYTRY
ncbi:uncharacterized protein [Periplaneta americana]|uniref:uncharacterized protein isoform X2 n=1 Tax=Periplaneta americana TaxID=6978 RepID=UPI0037E88803